MKDEFSNPDTVNNVIKNILKDNEPLNMNTPNSIKTPENIIQDMMSRETTVEDILNFTFVPIN